MEYGFSKSEIKEIIQFHLDQSPDLKFYINNPYFDEFVSLLLDGISDAIMQNAEKVIEDILNELERHNKVWK